MGFYQLSERAEFISKILLPGKRAHRMGGKRNEVGGDSKEEDLIFGVKKEDSMKTIKVVPDRLYQSFR